ncbi:MAG: T9SS type A sorting domain-containing protein [Bacteroidetes bacterium]|nr:T9SS type A sorting domain-containing protein [Bacteroidota bacterium]
MKKSFLPALLFLSFLATAQQASTNWCGTQTSPDYIQKYFAKDRSNQYFSFEERGGINWVPVFYHIITKSDGTGGVGYKPIFESHCELNEIYNVFNIGFYIAGIDTIKNTTLWEYQSQFLGYQAFSQYNEPNTCNVYVNGNLPGLCGFATFPNTAPGGGGIFMDDGCMGTGTTTYPHEMGHYMGLLHTFDDGNGIEFVNGTNCNNAGDGFCDTPADFLDQRTPCPYTGNQTDPNGDLYNTVIDETLYMSYFNDACTNRFSNQQMAEMNSVLINERPNLLNQTLPDLSQLPTPTFTSPTSGDTTLVGSVTIRWNSIPNARYYFFRFQNANASIVYVDTVLADTSFTVNGLAPGKSFRYKVKGISYGNTCSPYSPLQDISTSDLTVSVVKADPNCPAESNAFIILNPANGTAPYSFAWSNNGTTASLTNLAAGTYTATITDANGEVAVTTVVLTEPQQVGVTINKVGNNLTAVPSGGTSPYSYSWSNGEQFAGNNGITFGTYTVTVTDAKGCTASETFVFSSNGIQLEQKASMSVFPNPVAKNELLNVQITTNERSEALLSIVNMTGALVSQKNVELQSGSNQMTLATTDISSGIYFVKLTTPSLTKTVRVSVTK